MGGACPFSFHSHPSPSRSCSCFTFPFGSTGMALHFHLSYNHVLVRGDETSTNLNLYFNSVSTSGQILELFDGLDVNGTNTPQPQNAQTLSSGGQSPNTVNEGGEIAERTASTSTVAAEAGNNGDGSTLHQSSLEYALGSNEVCVVFPIWLIYLIPYVNDVRDLLLKLNELLTDVDCFFFEIGCGRRKHVALPYGVPRPTVVKGRSWLLVIIPTQRPFAIQWRVHQRSLLELWFFGDGR